MAATAELDAIPDTIGADLDYFVDTGMTPVTLVGEFGGRDLRTGGGRGEQRRVLIRNGRLSVDRFDLEREGFRFVPHRTAVADFYDEAELRKIYYPEMEALIKAQSGARRVLVFDHTLRTDDGGLRETRKIREVVRRVHNDYTEWSGPQRVRDLLPDEAEALLQRRFAIIQVWRPVHHPVECWPLAIADAQTISAENLVVTERHYPGRVGQTYAITWNPAHRWYWFPGMQPDEALVFKTFESATDGRARWTAHTAFDDPLTRPGARPRESIEIRALAFF